MSYIADFIKRTKLEDVDAKALLSNIEHVHDTHINANYRYDHSIACALHRID